jgi:hypothetical protein
VRSIHKEKQRPKKKKKTPREDFLGINPITEGVLYPQKSYLILLGFKPDKKLKL